MNAVFVFALTLLLAMLLSELAHRSVLSTAVMFLAAGYVAGAFGWVTLKPGDPLVSRLADFALFSVLFTDGMRACWNDLKQAWRLPGRALLFGLPLTVLATAAAAHYAAGLTWLEGLLLGAILSPTDPVLAAAIVGREEIPNRLRHLLNVESGLNDGLALPLVLVLLAHAGAREVGILQLGEELALGVALGVALAWLTGVVERWRIFAVSSGSEPLLAFAVGLATLSLSSLLHANEYLAGFAGGVTMATVRPDLRDAFRQFGEHVTELLKLSALLVFGAFISQESLFAISLGGYVFAALALVVARPLALALALIGTQLTWKEELTAWWFGPKGFASVVYGLLLLSSGLNKAEHLFHLVALVVVGSVLAHSSTDVLIARYFARSSRRTSASG